MYTGFNLKCENLFTKPQEEYYLKKGKELFKQYSNNIEIKLDELILENGNIDGGKMQGNWFPTVEADIFLSHSHKNEKEAIALSGYLYDKLGLKTFVDSCIWGYSANLLKELDKKFCKRDDGYYDYNKRNFTTSNVHMMLSTALTKMMDKSECLFFFNTPESISFKQGVKSSTLSPWIYAEIETSKMLRHKKLSEYRKLRKETRFFAKEDVQLNESIQYPIDLDHLTSINQKDIIKWVNSYNNEEYPLDLLYYFIGKDLVFI
ncbi:hypothetical protein Q4553_13310 [Tenacibaculum soleae]|uniref:hypothetical protein n=1 Tax=Tenacibaculum soleae TaxID=447689 RepID=UPI0026E19459|nr:hypothetical protein [Tenacibaculum soleae]MDO6745541.1 hypothetical protein [Tenacibaculum soleae]